MTHRKRRTSRGFAELCSRLGMGGEVLKMRVRMDFGL